MTHQQEAREGLMDGGFPWHPTDGPRDAKLCQGEGVEVEGPHSKNVNHPGGCDCWIQSFVE